PNGSDLDGFSRIGYTFSGWATTSAGPVDSSYSSGNSGKLPNSLTLYAIWKPINYTVKYLPGTHGSFAEQITGGLHYSDLTPAAPKASGEAGWKFDGWDKTIASKVTGNATYTAVWKPIAYTVKYLPGTHGSFAEQVTGGLHYGGNTPAAPTITGEAGWQFDGWDKTIATKVTGNATYTALWSEIPSGGGEEEEPPIVDPPRPPVDITPDPEPVVEDIAEPIEPEVPAPAPTITKESVDVRLANQTGNPILDLLNGNVPLGGFASKGAWSLLSLLMSLVAVVVSVLLVVGIFMRRRDDDDEDERLDEDREEEDRRRRGKILKTLTIIVGIMTPIVWLVLDNLNQPMVWINNWTVFVGITFIVHIALLIAYKFRKGNEEQEEEDNAAVA
ncbi:MAG: InlB B-repeat-containing protein, partial [Clostridiales Family XIII bacterium]|nr:InlB B-repeat-containing protein [Clostridiales Family XIII bacterium]